MPRPSPHDHAHARHDDVDICCRSDVVARPEIGRGLDQTHRLVDLRPSVGLREPSYTWTEVHEGRG